MLHCFTPCYASTYLSAIAVMLHDLLDCFYSLGSCGDDFRLRTLERAKAANVKASTLSDLLRSLLWDTESACSWANPDVQAEVIEVRYE